MHTINFNLMELDGDHHYWLCEPSADSIGLALERGAKKYPSARPVLDALIAALSDVDFSHDPRGEMGTGLPLRSFEIPVEELTDRGIFAAIGFLERACATCDFLGWSDLLALFHAVHAPLVAEREKRRTFGRSARTWDAA